MLNMNYIVLDLEWNQSPNGKEREHKQLPFEIIEIGAMKLDSKKQCVGKFTRLIQPVVYKEFHSYTQNMLSLTMKDLKNGESFVKVMKDFLEDTVDEKYYINNEKADKLIANIARYANSQNKVSDADLWSNHPFHIRMEDFSR